MSNTTTERLTAAIQARADEALASLRKMEAELTAAVAAAEAAATERIDAAVEQVEAALQAAVSDAASRVATRTQAAISAVLARLESRLITADTVTREPEPAAETDTSDSGVPLVMPLVMPLPASAGAAHAVDGVTAAFVRDEDDEGEADDPPTPEADEMSVVPETADPDGLFERTVVRQRVRYVPVTAPVAGTVYYRKENARRYVAVRYNPV